MSNDNLHKAKKEKNDEFYTLLEDIEEELVHYKKEFEDKIVYCNCDNPDKSNFYRYFKNNFIDLKLKKLICSCCIDDERSFYCIYDGNKETRYDFEDDFFYTKGDFRSQECVKLLKGADIVVTNPPFSLFREFISLLTKYDKKFIVVGNQNAITYKEVFPLMKENKISLGYRKGGSEWFFESPYEDYAVSNHHKENLIRFASALWFTNFKTDKGNIFIPLKEKYVPEKYPYYDNYNAINVNRTEDMPMDYDGIMGVPVTFMYKYNPEQFEIVGHDHDLNGNGGDGVSQFEINGKGIYKRILIRKRK